MTIRKDPRQWLIYDPDSVAAVMAGVENLLMAMGAQVLLNHPDQAVRAIGHFGARVAETRMAIWSGDKNIEPTEEQREVARHLGVIAAYLGGGERPEVALDDFHAAVVWLDKRAREAGVAGPGWYRELVRGEVG